MHALLGYREGGTRRPSSDERSENPCSYGRRQGCLDILASAFFAGDLSVGLDFGLPELILLPAVITVLNPRSHTLGLGGVRLDELRLRRGRQCLLEFRGIPGVRSIHVLILR